MSEQQLCVSCGFCCDGTLFDTATLVPEEKGTLPEKMEENYVTTGDKEYFRLPCPYFDGRCTIYQGKKAYVCSAFRCKLLRDVARGRLLPEEASAVIGNARHYRNEILQLAQALLPAEGATCFRHTLTSLNNMLTSLPDGKAADTQQMILVGRCNILDALFTRHFKSRKLFNKMIDTSGNDHAGD